MFLPNFNTKAMTDQELLDATTKIHKRLGFASRFSNDDMLMNQLRSMAEACAFEAREREAMRLYELLNKNTSDQTDLTPENSTDEQKTNGKTPVKSSRSDNVFKTKRTAQPSKDV